MSLLVLVRRAAVAPIVVYRRILSPLKPATCRFSPTCSAYAHEAILSHGVVRGGGLALWRILRCQPFARGGHDPVPPRRGDEAAGAAAAGPDPGPSDDRPGTGPPGQGHVATSISSVDPPPRGDDP